MHITETANKFLIKFAMGLLLLSVLACEMDINITQASNGYLSSGSYYEFRVATGDSVWSIASKLTTDKEDIRELIYAIRQVNSLSQNAEIHPGQVLKIPNKSKSNP